jgi:hypothetical protein
MSVSGKWRRAKAAFAAAIALAAASGAVAAGSKLSALSRLEPGLWQFRDLDNARAAQQAVCIADPILLMQLRHRTAPCTRLVVADNERDAVVHYTCPASGFGQTALRVETPRLAQIDTQGIVDNRPFALRAEARRVGPCQSSARR